MSLRYPSNDNDLKAIVRGMTDYADNADELPDTSTGTGTSMTKVIERAKAKVELETGSTAWYSDDGLGYALAAYAAMKAKAAVENFAIVNYTLGDEQVTTRNADPESNQQIQEWADDVVTGLNASSVDTKQSPGVQNTSGYIGEHSTHDDGSYRTDI